MLYKPEKIRFSLLFAMILTLTGCERRSFCRVVEEGVSIAVQPDWSAAGLKPEHVKFLLYRNGSAILTQYYINPDGERIDIAEGSYLAFLYNWQSNGDVQYIKFENESDPARFRARTDFKSGSLFRDDVLLQPDSLYVWCSGTRTVSIDEEGVSVGGSPWNRVLRVKPLSQVCSFDFSIPVTGTRYVKNAEAVISGVSRYKMLESGEITGPGHLMSVTMIPSVERLRFHFSAFGFVPGEAHVLYIKFILLDGTDFEIAFDLTDQIRCGIIPDINRMIDIPYAEGDEGGGFTDPEIGEWEEDSDDILI